MSDDWVEKANAGREAWWALSTSEREDLLAEWPCAACPNCTELRGHLTPHTCDCVEAWR